MMRSPRSPEPRRFRARQLALLITFASLLAPGTGLAAEALRVDALGVQVRVPEGWRVLRAVEGRGVTIGPARGGGEALDILAWAPVAERLSAEAAALAHEQVLAARFRYTPTSHERFTTPNGAGGVLAVGMLQGPADEQQASLFAAYLMGRLYYIVGTVCAPEDVAAVRAGYFDEAARTLSPLGARLPAPAPHPLPDPVQPPDPGPPAAPDTPVTPEPPAREPTVPAILTPHRDRLGFALPIPRGWVVTVQQGCVQAWPPDRPRRWGAITWPLLREGDLPIEARAAHAMREAARLLGGQMRALEVRPAAGPHRTVVCSALLTLDGNALRAVGTLVAGADHDILQVVLFAPDTSEEDRLRLARVPAGFESAPVWVAPPAEAGEAEWVDRDGALQARVPGDWVVIGGLRLHNGMVALDIEGRHPPSGARFAWRQPELPCHKDLTPALAAAGWREGSEFPPDQGIDALIIAPRPEAVIAARRRALAGGALTLQTSGTAPRAARLLPGGEGAAAHAAGGTDEATCLLAVADAPARLGDDCWMTAALRHEGPRDAHRAAGAALRGMILSAQVNPRWLASDEERGQLRALLAGAREAAADLPAEAPRVEAAPPARPVYAAPATEDTLGARRLSLNETPPWLWRLATDPAGARRRLPELLGGEDENTP